MMSVSTILLHATICAVLGGVLGQTDWAAELSNEMDPAHLEEFLRILTEKPHLPGTQEGYDLAEYVRQTWVDQGLDSAHINPYNILLSYPDTDNPSYAAILDDQDNELFRTSPGEPQLDVDPAANISLVVPPFAAYSPSGVVEGRLMYVNYGRSSDFELVKTLGKPRLRGKIAIARYGRTSRGRILRRAQENKMIGLIVYTDPKEVRGNGYGLTRQYPDGWYAPGTAVQRGHFMYTTGEGEPLTPGYPATDYAFRIEQRDSGQLPKIPAYPIGYNDAMELLSFMRGPEVPEAWRGLLDVKYRRGPGFRKKFTNATKVRLNVNVQTERRTIHNVVGIIRGSLEPDRYVVLGNHRDAWNLGALDPNSGTACLLEITRACGQLLQRGWRPRRTLMFISWDAEEHGIHGSYEFIEEFGKILSDRAVAYINVDIGVRETYTLRARATPSLRTVLKESAMNVEWPESTSDGSTLYEVWRKRSPADSSDENSPPKISLPASSSDFVPFVNRIGVPILDLAMVHRYTYTYPNYPLYHTAYETFHLQKTYIDPEFKFHRLMSQLWAGIAFSLAEEQIVPIDVSEYVATVQEMFDTLQVGYSAQFATVNVSLNALESAVNNFTQAGAAFVAQLNSVGNDTNPLTVRMYNDQLMQMERAFIDPLGIPYWQFQRHTVLSAGSFSSHDTFPALGDAVSRLGSSGWTDYDKRWKLRDMKKQLAIITFFIQSAANTLTTPGSTVF